MCTSIFVKRIDPMLNIHTTKRKGNMRKPWKKVLHMSITLIVVMALKLIAYIQIHQLYILNVCSPFHVNYTSISLSKKKPKGRKNIGQDGEVRSTKNLSLHLQHCTGKTNVIILELWSLLKTCNFQKKVYMVNCG